jgi:hypothetical protein
VGKSQPLFGARLPDAIFSYQKSHMAIFGHRRAFECTMLGNF